MDGERKGKRCFVPVPQGNDHVVMDGDLKGKRCGVPVPKGKRCGVPVPKGKRCGATVPKRKRCGVPDVPKGKRYVVMDGEFKGKRWLVLGVNTCIWRAAACC